MLDEVIQRNKCTLLFPPTGHSSQLSTQPPRQTPCLLNHGIWVLGDLPLKALEGNAKLGNLVKEQWFLERLSEYLNRKNCEPSEVPQRDSELAKEGKTQE